MARSNALIGTCPSRKDCNNNGKPSGSIIELIRQLNEKSKPALFTSKSRLQAPTQRKRPSLITDYAFQRELGRGASATAHSAVHNETGTVLVLKSFHRLLKHKTTGNNEVAILKKLKHRNIVKFIEEVDSAGFVCIALEYLPGPSLRSLIDKQKLLNEAESKVLFKQLLEGMAYCHMQKIYHRDIKLENIILDASGVPKLIDFGFAVQSFSDKKTTKYIGTPPYMAPEIVSRSEWSAGPADVWALGVVLFAMLCGRHPFVGLNENELDASIMKGDFCVPESLSGEVQELLAKMLVVDPVKRITVLQALTDPWVATNSSTCILNC